MLRRLRRWWETQKHYAKYPPPDIILPDIHGGHELSAQAIQALNKLADRAKKELDDPVLRKRYERDVNRTLKTMAIKEEQREISEMLNQVVQEHDDNQSR